MLKLYQFPISHYCEKIRWALDYKHLDYEIKNLLPGLHVLKTRRLAPDTSVPILVDGDVVVQESSRIISYLDEKFPERSLTPENPQLREEALEWEKYADSEIGIHVRRCCYHILLEHPEIVIPFFTHDGPWYGRLVVPRMFPKLKVKMRALMKINETTFQRSKERMGIAIDRLHGHLQDHKFLVGDTFTRADLATAALLAPLCRPAKYGLNWPAQFPAPLEELVDEFRERIAWVDGVYERFR